MLGRFLLHHPCDLSPEAGLLGILQARFVVHSELDSVDAVNFSDELCQRGFGVGDEVVGGDAPHKALCGLSQCFLGAGDVIGLHAAAVDVIPDADRYVDSVRVRLGDQPVERGEILLLLLGRDADHAHIGEFVDVEEIRVRRREESAVFVAEDQHETVETIGASRSK